MFVMKISVVIVTFNKGQKAVECIKSLQQCDFKNFLSQLKVLVVDNASINNTVKIIKKIQDSKDSKLQLELIENKENLGFGVASNIGIKKALQHKADYVLLLNPDTTVQKDFLKPLLQVIKRPEIGICGPKILFFSSPRRRLFGDSRSVLGRIWSAGGEIDQKRYSGGLIGYGEKDEGQYSKEKEVDYISGTCMLVKSIVFEKIGFLNEDYFLYYEDAEFCLRARRAGFKVVYVPSSVIYHYGSYTTGRGSQMMQYYLARNRLYFLEKNAPFTIRLREMVRMPKTIWEHLNRKERAALLGIRDYLFRKRGIKEEFHSR